MTPDQQAASLIGLGITTFGLIVDKGVTIYNARRAARREDATVENDEFTRLSAAQEQYTTRLEAKVKDLDDKVEELTRKVDRLNRAYLRVVLQNERLKNRVNELEREHGLPLSTWNDDPLEELELDGGTA